MATMKDVAQRAGVSLSTVSYVLSGARPISEATRAVIQKAMEELNFQPNAVARALASKRSRVIALLLSPEERGLGISELEFVRSASEAARIFEHHLVLLTQGMDSAQDLEYLKHQGLVDGLILMEVRLNDPRVQLLRDIGLPFSIIGRADPAMNIPFVDIDFDRTFEDVLKHLAELDHRCVGFISQSREVFDSGYGPVVRAEEAVRKWSGELEVSVHEAFSHSSPRDGYEACMKLFADEPGITAVVVMNDRALPGVLQALAVKGLKVPEDVSVLSAVTSPAAAEMMMPALSSADAPSLELARLGVRNLVRTIDQPAGIIENTLIGCRLVKRDSTGKAPRRSRSRR